MAPLTLLRPAGRPTELVVGKRKTLSEEEGVSVNMAGEPEEALSDDSVHTSLSHLTAWHEAAETCIILDWDDTIFPTTFVWSDGRLRWDTPAPCFGPGGEQMPADAAFPEGPRLRDVLEQHASAAAALLRLAASLGHVAIVTLAEEGWIEMSIRHFLPGLRGVLEELGIEVVHARTRMTARLFRRAVCEDGYALGKLLKTEAILRVVKQFYGGRRRRRRTRSWKNVLSIGDSSDERLALQDVIFQRKQQDSKGVYKMCRCKVVKILSEPSLGALTAELQVLTAWLCKLARHDGDVDMDLGELDDLDEAEPVLN